MPSAATSPCCSAIWSVPPSCRPGSTRRTCARCCATTRTPAPASSRAMRLRRQVHGRWGLRLFRLPARPRGRRRAGDPRRDRSPWRGARSWPPQGRSCDPRRDRHRPGGGGRSAGPGRIAGGRGHRRDAEPGGAASEPGGRQRDRGFRCHLSAGGRSLRMPRPRPARPEGLCRAGADLVGWFAAARSRAVSTPPAPPTSPN